jgi:uncharacterized protein (DUF849 family)
MIISAALTGNVHTPTMSPYLPVTPKQIADEAVRVYEAGAAVAHIHVRDPKTGQPTADLDLYREVLQEVKSRCDIICCVTTGGLNPDVQRRMAPVPTFSLELASFNSGSMNFGLFPMAAKPQPWKFEWEKPYLEATEENIFPNTFRTIRQYCETFKANQTRPELEVYALGMINNVAYFVNQGLLEKPGFMQFVLGILGGAPATIDNLVYMYNTARDLLGDFHWSVCAAGRFQMNMCTTAAMLGGNARVGLEDNLYLEKGQLAKSNAEQVEKLVRVVKELGREPATPAEARKILNLKGLDKVNY